MKNDSVIYRLIESIWPGNQYILDTAKILWPGFKDTVHMTFYSSLLAVIIGTAAGVILYMTTKGGIWETSYTNPYIRALGKLINLVLGTIVNIGRSIPFVIIIIAVFPLSKILVGTSLGRTAAIVPLTVAAAPFVARVIESALNDLNKGVIEAAISAGASNFQIIMKVLLPETAPGIISGITITIINLIGYSAMAGTIGGGGLGNVAITIGYQRFRNDILIYVIIILVLMVQLIQALGNLLAKAFDNR